MKESGPSTMVDSPETRANIGCNATYPYSGVLGGQFYDKRWFKASALLRADPSLLTSKILIMALKNHAPLHVIKFFMSVNSKAAGIPEEGPTPLQVAVQHNASKEVIRLLIEACPFALVVTTSAEWLDPLTYARRHRSSETELIALLSRPLGSWIHPKEKEDAEKREEPATSVASSATPRALPTGRVPPPPPLFRTKPAKFPSPDPNEAPPFFKTRRSSFSKAEQQELQNVKELCYTVMKGQKRLVREVGRVKSTVQKSAVEVERKGEPQRPEVTMEDVRTLQEIQQQNLKAHLIALDMKEQAMRAYVRSMEAKILESVEAQRQGFLAEQYESAVDGIRDQLDSAAHRMDDFINSLEKRMVDFEGRLDRESMVNTTFRDDLQHRLDTTKSDVSQQEGFEVIQNISIARRRKKCTPDDKPFIFATPYSNPNIEEEMPLFPERESLWDDKAPGSCFLMPRFINRRLRENSPYTS